MTELVSPGRLARAPVASVTMSSNGVARPVLVAVAWPYASGSRHLGHLAGAYLPADVFARFQRRVGNRVLMVSGSDVHGTPITVRADADGVTPNDIVDRYHAEFVDNWERLGISWDRYTSTGTDNHAAVTHDIFLRLLGKPSGSCPTATSRAPARTATTPRHAATSARAAGEPSTRRS